jgi:hypothetical protein
MFVSERGSARATVPADPAGSRLRSDSRRHGARDKKWLIMPIERPGTFQITPPGFDAATTRVR